MTEQLPATGERIWQTHARFRELGPVIPLGLPGGVDAWAATSHAAVREVLQGDNRLFGKHLSKWRAYNEGRVPDNWVLMPLVRAEHMLAQDGADHARLRRLMSSAFSPARVKALEPFIERVVDDLLSDMGATADLVPALAEQVPMAVICELFGVPDADRGSIRQWSSVLFSHTATPEDANTAGRDLLAYISGLVEAKRGSSDDDLTTALIRAHDDGDRLSTEELVDSLHLMLVAGHETTLHLIGSAVIALLTHPDQLAAVVESDRWSDAIEETLRLRSPVAGTIFRYALQDVTIAGVTIPAGDAVYLCYSGAVTDPAAYGEDAARFDIDRENRGQLAFGHGPHFCLGAPLGRMEARIALSRLFRRFPEMKLTVDPEQVPYTPSFITSGPMSVPVALR
ncbi:cytochrome P450 family protein [Mycobacterium sp. NPDC003449]